MANAKTQWLTCKRCNTKVYDTVITKHMWKSHRAYMMKNRGGRQKNPLQDKPIVMRGPVKLPKPYSMLEAHRGEKVDGRTAWGRMVNAERKREAEQKARAASPKSGVAPKKPMPKEYLSDIELALMAGSGKPTAESKLLQRAAYSALPGKTLTLIVYQGRNSIEINAVTLIEVLE